MLSFKEIRAMNLQKNCHIEYEEISDKDIAVIGMSIKLPLADTLNEYWNNLSSGIDCVRKIPDNRKKDMDRYRKQIGKIQEDFTYEEIAFLEEIDMFDYEFFNISAKEAGYMDPNQRLFLQTAWGAVEDAGYVQKIISSNTGVYVGFSSEQEYKQIIPESERVSQPLSLLGNTRTVISSRVSYFLDLVGTCLTVDTACSSSLVALHMACKAIRNGEIDMAIVGGSQLHIIPFRDGYLGVESQDGRTRSFSHDSDGTGTGEGVVAVLLKSFSEAVKDHDHIYAVIKGSAVNSDGKSNGLTTPNPLAQEKVIVNAWKDAGISPENITYIETHGTATKLGDPVEIEGLKRSFRQYTNKKGFCAIGSCKSNIGHLSSTAGLAGFVKTVLSLQNKKVPATMFFNRPNALIDFMDSPVYVNNELKVWESEGKRICGVSSFGIGGTNCHVVLEEAPQATIATVRHPSECKILCLSARTIESLSGIVRQYINFLEKDQDIRLGDICFTANTGRGHYSHRLAILCRDFHDLKAKLLTVDSVGLSSQADKDIFYGSYAILHEGENTPKEGHISREEKKRLDSEAGSAVDRLVSDGFTIELLERTAALYIKGADLHWDEVYVNEVYTRVSLPTYCFKKNRCWVDEVRSGPETFNVNRLMYRPLWIHNENKSILPLPHGERILLINHTSIRGRVVAESLQAKGMSVTYAHTGNRFEQEEAHVFQTGRSREDFVRLFLGIGIGQYSKIIDFQTVDGISEVGNISDLELKLDQGVYSFINMLRALSTEKMSQPIEIVVVSEYMDEVTGEEKQINPENATLVGIAMTAALENTNIACRCIDIDEETTADGIMAELQTRKADYKVAYRNGKRFTEVIDKLPPLHNQENFTVTDEGVYIIAGGLGDIGLNFARFLALENGANVALIGRSVLPEMEAGGSEAGENTRLKKQLNIYQALKQQGARLSYYSADICDYSAMSHLLDGLRKKYTTIKGVIHAAGVGAGMHGKPIAVEDEDIFRQVLAPKIQGTWILDMLTRQDKLEFFVMFSTAMTLIGGVGSAHYVAAHCYLDTYAFYRGRKQKKTITINWAHWGTDKLIKSGRIDEDTHIFKILNPEIGVKAFREIVASDVNRVIVGELNYDSTIYGLGDYLPFKMSAEITEEIKEPEKARHPCDSMAKTAVNGIQLRGRDSRVYTDVEKRIASAWREVLGFDTFNIYENFFEIGGNSIMIGKVHALIHQEFPDQITVTDLFAYPTIQKLSDHISGHVQEDTNRQPSVSPQSTAEYMALLDRIEQGHFSVDDALESLQLDQ